MKLLVTGGAGYIGSHTIIELIKAGHEPVILDNFVNASEKVIGRLETITGRKIPVYRADIRDRIALEEIFKKESFEGCIHFAGL
ncbi:MAG: GDP-mannose 4,6-dehydratase, partial [Lachnospiraceae bacterium]|nr:GDP-mannose 4,6-dehydratase [Lachnospiraceae bacterium]